LWHEFPHDFAVSSHRRTLLAFPSHGLRVVGLSHPDDLVAAICVINLSGGLKTHSRYGMVAGRGETEAGSAGTQPARDNLAEASKRRQGGAKPASPPLRAARFSP
jgi:hypothetical protein